MGGCGDFARRFASSNQARSTPTVWIIRPTADGFETFAAFDCADGCEDAADEFGCTIECIETEFGLSENCSTCYADFAFCVFDNCDHVCGGPEDGAECDECIRDSCDARHGRCTGDIGGGGGPTATIRVVHMGAGTGPISAFVGGSIAPFVEDVAYASMGVGQVPPGESPVSARLSSADPGSEALATAGSESGYGADEIHTFVVYPVGGDVPAVAATLQREDTSTPPEGTRRRFFNAASGVPTMDIYDAGGDTPTLLHEAVAMGSGTPDSSRPPGSLTIGLDVNDDAAPDMIIDLGEQRDGSQSVFWIGIDEDTGLPFALASRLDGSSERFDGTEVD